ncbi:hypothetical protein [Neobacillus soli]|uniref:hypothetical protein n=1 Tax=Neobacillus soli TaxID=220688 RepID=UPI0008256209|nr:hypothetical protein [Neobacillus soli]
MTHPKETTNLLKTEKNQKINKRKEEPSELDYTFVSSRVPQRFVQFVICFFPDAKLIEEYWHMTHIQVHELNMEINEVVNLAIKSFRQLIRKLKITKAVRKPIAYYYGILQEKPRDGSFVSKW